MRLSLEKKKNNNNNNNNKRSRFNSSNNKIINGADSIGSSAPSVLGP